MAVNDTFRNLCPYRDGFLRVNAMERSLLGLFMLCFVTLTALLYPNFRTNLSKHRVS
jgi:hypothetical protein